MTNRDDHQERPERAHGATTRTEHAPPAPADSLPLSCAACGVVMPAGSQFCLGCGTKLSAPTGGEMPTSAPTTGQPGTNPPTDAAPQRTSQPQQSGHREQNQDQENQDTISNHDGLKWALPERPPSWLLRLRGTSARQAYAWTIALILAWTLIGAFVYYPRIVHWSSTTLIMLFGLARLNRITIRRLLLFYALAVGTFTLNWTVDVIVSHARNYDWSLSIEMPVLGANLGAVSLAAIVLIYLDPNTRVAIRSVLGSGNSIDPAKALVTLGLVALALIPLIRSFTGSFEFGVYRTYVANGTSDPQSGTYPADELVRHDQVACRLLTHFATQPSSNSDFSDFHNEAQGVITHPNYYTAEFMQLTTDFYNTFDWGITHPNEYWAEGNAFAKYCSPLIP
jgi:hypothetical protein